MAGTMAKHRKIMAEVLGEGKLEGKEVHHIDCNPFNNDPANLCVLSKAEHARVHSEMRRRGISQSSAPGIGKFRAMIVIDGETREGLMQLARFPKEISEATRIRVLLREAVERELIREREGKSNG